MIRVRDSRFVTLCCVVGLAAFALKPALSVIGYGWLEATGGTAEQLAAYSNTPGIASLAREALLDQPLPGDRLVALNMDLLSGRPLLARGWLGLAWREIGDRSGLKMGLSAAAISNVTGPNEGYVMASRAQLLLPLWSRLTPELRAGAVGDVVNAWGMIGEAGRQDLRSGVDGLLPLDRETLRSALLLAGDPATPVLAGLGLATAAAKSGDGLLQPQPVVGSGSVAAPSAVGAGR